MSKFNDINIGKNKNIVGHNNSNNNTTIVNNHYDSDPKQNNSDQEGLGMAIFFFTVIAQFNCHNKIIS